MLFRSSVVESLYPEIEEKYLVDDMVTYIIQVNGKLRGRFDFNKGLTKDDLLAQAMKESNVAKYIEGKELRKVIFVPDKLLNVVV